MTKGPSRSKYLVHLTKNNQDTFGLLLILTHPLSFGIEMCKTPREASRFIKNYPVHGLIIDYPSFDKEAFQIIEAFQKQSPTLPIIVVTGSKGVKEIVVRLKALGITAIVRGQIVEVEKIQKIILKAIKVPSEITR